jgi:hypothetical protein
MYGSENKAERISASRISLASVSETFLEVSSNKPTAEMEHRPSSERLTTRNDAKENDLSAVSPISKP